MSVIFPSEYESIRRATLVIHRSIPDTESARSTSRLYADHPHLAGSKEDFEDAKAVLKFIQEELSINHPEVFPVFPAGSTDSRNATLGLTSATEPTAWIDVYYPVMNTPISSSLEIIGDDGKPAWVADLVEDGDERDPVAAKYRNAVPTFHGYSKDGEVEGELIYANYGNKEDYDELVAAGANFTGKVVLARYGDTGRGLKVG